jgi:predicted lipid-binding transport protein (Tim44 family)
MKLNVNSPAVPAICGLATGLGLGLVVAGAAGWNLQTYMRFAGLLVLIALIAVGAWAYQRFLKPAPPAVEEAPDGR